MKDYERHVQNVIASDSMDLEVGRTIQYLMKFLAAANVDYIVVGSAALQSYLEYCQQLPRDLDVTLSERDVGKIEDACKSDQHLRFVHHDIACKVLFDGGFYLHLIPSDMKIVDKIERTVFTTANIFHADRTEYRALRFVNFGKGIRIRVPVLEYTFCMNLNRPIDSNTFSGYTAIIERHLLKPELMSEFIERVPMMGRIARARLVTLRGLLHRYRPDLSARLPVI